MILFYNPNIHKPQKKFSNEFKQATSKLPNNSSKTINILGIFSFQNKVFPLKITKCGIMIFYDNCTMFSAKSVLKKVFFVHATAVS